MYDKLRKELSVFTETKNYTFYTSLDIKISLDSKEFSKIQTVACNSGSFGAKKDYCLVFTPKKVNVKFDEQSVKDWVRFMTNCGFKCTLEITDDRYEIYVYFNDYENLAHFKCGITAIRYLFYGLSQSKGYINIAEKAIEIFKETTLTPLEAFCKAHSTSKDYVRCAGHSLNHRPKLIKRTEMLKRCETMYSVNLIFENDKE